MESSNLPKYKKIEQNLVQTILKNKMKAGEQLPPELELAKNYNVNRLTIRKAEKLLIDKGILVSAQGCGTFLSDSFKSEMLTEHYVAEDTDKTIVVLFPEVTSFFYEIIKEIEKEATQKGYSICVMFNNDIERENETVNALLSKQIDGVIATPLRSNHQMSILNYKRLLDSQIPLVMVGKPPVSIRANCVMCDDISAVYQVMEYFYTQKYDDVVFIYHSLGDYEANMERQTGFELGMRDFFAKGTYSIFDMASENWFEEFQELVNPMKRVAIFTDAEYIVFDIYSYFIKQGKTYNQDFDIVVYNNTNALKQLNLNIHYIDLPKKEMGKGAFDLLQEMMAQQPFSALDPVTHKVFTPNFII